MCARDFRTPKEPFKRDSSCHPPLILLCVWFFSSHTKTNRWPSGLWGRWGGTATPS